MRRRLWLALALALALGGCDDGGAAALAGDAAVGDAATSDAASADAAAPDAAPADAAPPDAEPTEDAAALDAAPPDADVPPPDPGPLNTVEEALDLVDPFLGTGGVGFGYAAMTPAVQRPAGMVRLGPDTTRRGIHPYFNHFSGYHFDDPQVRGFSHTHFVGTGVEDYGNLRVLPVADLEAAWVDLDKSTERASPGLYTVSLVDPPVDVALTATTRAGLHRYRFRDAGRVWLRVDATASVRGDGVSAATVEVVGGALEGELTFDGSYTGRQRPFTLSFAGTLEPPPVEAVVADGVAHLAYDAAPGDEVRLRIGVSFIDRDHARAHLADELGGRPFDEVVGEGRAAWADKLRRVRLAGGTEGQRRIFFTALYNAYRLPTRLDEAGGHYRGLDGEVHRADGFAYYTDLSLWDTFRTLHPWLALTDVEMQRDCLRSMLAMRADGGRIPRWPAALSYTGGMIGSSADIVFAESAQKGIDDVDYLTAFLALDDPATTWRSGLEDYEALGYLPVERHGGSVSKTLEYAYDDAALGALAGFLGRADDAARLRARSESWRNLLDPDTGFMTPRHADGTFAEVDPLRFDAGGSPYTEGTAWHWAFYVPHDPEGLAEALGGPDALAERLEAFFAQSRLGREGPVDHKLPDPYYWHGNEPTLHSAYLFHAAGRPDRLHFWAREIQTRIYTEGPAGLPGNDDGGTMSAWYLFSTLGLYPRAGSDRYFLGAPLFPKAEIDLGDGRVLTVDAPRASVAARFVRGVTLDDAPVDAELTHAALLGGRRLVFDLRRTP